MVQGTAVNSSQTTPDRKSEWLAGMLMIVNKVHICNKLSRFCVWSLSKTVIICTFMYCMYQTVPVRTGATQNAAIKNHPRNTYHM